MANGAAIALPLELDPAPAPRAEIERQIGEAVAAAACAVCTGVGDWAADGALADDTKAKAGDLFVALYWLQEAFGEIHFNVTARREGARVFRQRYAEALRQQFGATLSDAELDAALDTAIDEILSWPLSILTKITAIERALAN
jgi:triphosphoribosyl-dephospho-CoA synthetase